MNIDVDKIVVSLDVVAPDAVVVEASAVAPSGIVIEAVAELPTQVIVISHEETPTVTPLEIIDFGSSSIECAFDVTTEQAEEVVKGVLCGTTNPPTFENADYRLLHGQGSMDLVIAGLHRNTEYYLRPYALSNLGYKYGDVVAQRTKASPIPDEYQLVEYLQSTGEQLILLNNPLYGDTELYIDYTLNVNKQNSVIFGGREFIPYWLFVSGNSIYRFDYNAQDVFPISLSLNARRTIEMRINNSIMQCYSNDIITGARELFSNLCCNQISLFDGKTNTTQYLGGSIITLIFAEFKNSRIGYDIKLYPVYRKADNKPGMYDIVNNVFYINQGTGEFTVGQDKEWEE